MTKLKLLSMLLLLTVYSCEITGLFEEEEKPVNIEVLEERAAAAMESGDYDTALEELQIAIDNGNPSGESVILWSTLKMASVLIDENTQSIFKDLGIENYPTTFEESIQMQYTYEENNQLESSSDPLYGFTVTGSNDYLAVMDNNQFSAKLVAMLDNFQQNNPDGFNSVIDSVLAAYKMMDSVNEEINKLTEEDSFDIKYSMFFNEPFDYETSPWISEMDPTTGALVPIDITVGKGEVMAYASYMTMVRMVLNLISSVSLNADLDEYWAIFNPVDGKAYQENFDVASIPDPFQDGFLSQDADSEEAMALAKADFVGSLNLLNESYGIISRRTVDSNFYISPGNIYLADYWIYIQKVRYVVDNGISRIINSAENNQPFYIPQPDLRRFNDEMELLDYYGDSSKWPTSGLGINFYKLFEKPLFSFDNIFDVDSNGNFVIYKENPITYTLEKAVKSDIGTKTSFYIKVKDTTLNGALVNFPELPIETELPIPAFLAGHVLYPKGETFTVNGETFTSTGSFFTGMLKGPATTKN